MKSDKRKRKKEILSNKKMDIATALRQEQIIEVSRGIHVNNLTIIAK